MAQNEQKSDDKSDEKKEYQKPEIKTMTIGDLLEAVQKGANFPLRGFAG